MLRPVRRFERSCAWWPVWALFALAACSPERVRPRAEAPDPSERTIVLVPRTPHLAAYPCGEQCHDARTPDPAPRELREFHAGRRVEHGPALGWCERCHSLEDPDTLVSLGGDPISFDASDRLCAQCHGPEHADWEEGMHGGTTGGWRGTVRRRLCTACHDPHAPGPLHFEALPGPAGEHASEETPHE